VGDNPFVSANLDLVRSIYADWERGDFASADWAHLEIEFVVVDGPGPGRWQGLAGMAAGFRDVLDAWEDIRVEPDEFRDLDDDRVLVIIRRRGRGKTSGLDLAATRTQGATVFHIRGGKVTKLVLYWDRVSAFADLGLTPDTA
jgi:ketosteroid isomerase-like protein